MSRPEAGGPEDHEKTRHLRRSLLRLSDLTDGDLKHTVDFRSVFATVAQGCWGQPRDFGLRQPRWLGFL